MDPTDFSVKRSGMLVAIPEGGVAFVPETLPISDEVLTRDVAIELARAEQALGRLDGIAAILPDPELLIAPFLRKEAELSSRIEGTQTTYEDLLLYEIDRDHRSDAETREVANYVTALKYAMKRADEIPVGKTLICETHRLLLDGTSAEPMSGEFRRQQVFIAPKGQSIDAARFVPPPAHAIAAAFDNLDHYLTSNDDTPLLVRLAIAHYQFETIHPFFDGNGRLGRLLIPLILCKQGALRAPMLYISAYFERRRAQYMDSLLRVSTDGRWTEWIRFFLSAITAQSRDAVERIQQLHELRTAYHREVRTSRSAGALIKLIDALFEIPVMTNARAKSIIDQSLPTSIDNVRRLVDAGILVPGGKAARAQHYVAKQIFDVVNRTTTVTSGK